MNQFNKKQSRIIKIELTMIAIINVLFWLILGKVEIFERLYYFTREHEQYELDEFIPLMAMLLLSFLVFSFRRWKEASEYAMMVEKQTRIDELTGLYNQQTLSRKIASEFNRFSRYHEPFCVLTFSVDDFDSICQDHGNDYADEVLKTIALRVREHIREVDVFCRYSKEAFAILSPVTTEEGATMIAGKLTSIIAEPMFDEKSVSVSFGIMQMKSDIIVDDVMKIADVALYQAKSQGKGTIVVAGN